MSNLNERVGRIDKILQGLLDRVEKLETISDPTRYNAIKELDLSELENELEETEGG